MVIGGRVQVLVFCRLILHRVKWVISRNPSNVRVESADVWSCAPENSF